MSHFGDYMDGVPVKISEKYKRPPRIELPYSVVESPSRAQTVADSAKFECIFEKNVLSKVIELRNAKETRKNERRHRLQLLEEAKQKKLDLIAAAEAEEKLKQLSVSEVSYPSTEEISEMSPDDKTDKNCDTTITEDTQREIGAADTDTTQYCDPRYATPNTNIDQNILQPIQVMSINNQPSNLLDDPDPLQEIKLSTKYTKIPQYNSGYSKHNIDKLTFSDFENDTSSPFDNVELKTINDMELLAQVLQSQRESSTSCQPQQVQYLPQTYSAVGYQPLPSAYPEQGPPVMYTAPQQYPITNGYYLPAESICDNAITADNVNLYLPNYQYYVPTNQYQNVDTAYYGTQVADTTDINNQIQTEAYVPQQYYYGYPHLPVPYQPSMPFNSTIPSDNTTEATTQNPSVSSQSTIKSRSRSVPDIVKELNEELASVKLRFNERSYNTSPAPKEAASHSSSSSEKKSGGQKQIQQEILLDKLPTEQQKICLKIHGMGFPLDKVVRVCSLVGGNDKLMIDTLLVAGELTDLGFSESKVLSALSRNQYNRDKALDDLIK